MQDRKEVFEQIELEEEERKKLIEILDLQYMSSEESEGENTLKVKPLPWLTTTASQFKKTLDEEKEKQLNSQSKRQAKRKIVGDLSDRERPDGTGWMLKRKKQ